MIPLITTTFTRSTHDHDGYVPLVPPVSYSACGSEDSPRKSGKTGGPLPLPATAGLVSVAASGTAADTAFVTFDGVEIHLGVEPVPAGHRMGQHEGVLVEPDGNVIRFGSLVNAD